MGRKEIYQGILKGKLLEHSHLEDQGDGRI
jgi:hypothetical protein